MLNIGGLIPFTSIDYPDHLAAVIFCQGCPWRCFYCHNRHLQEEGIPGAVPWKEVLSFLDRRRGLLDAVVFSGGEPTLQPWLPQAVHEVKSRGFLVGLHTAGAFPARLNELLPHLDWVGMDIKAPFAEYELITGVPDSGEEARLSAELLLASGVPHEFRTTLHPLLARDEGQHILQLAQTLSSMGTKRYALQQVRSGEGSPPSAQPLQAVNRIAQAIAPLFVNFIVRN